MTGSTPGDRLRDLRDEARATWATVAGDTSACALARGGRSFPAATFHEGRSAALAALVRRPATPSTVAEDVAGVEALLLPRAVPGDRDWQAYAAGVRQGLEEAAALLAG